MVSIQAQLGLSTDAAIILDAFKGAGSRDYFGVILDWETKTACLKTR